MLTVGHQRNVKWQKDQVFIRQHKWVIDLIIVLCYTLLSPFVHYCLSEDHN